MKPDNEAPEIIFTWLENRDYKALSETERKTVLTYFTREEYDGMQEAFQAFSAGRRNARKEMVMDAYDQHHQVKIMRMPGTWTWKFAAAIMPVGLIALIFFLKEGNSELGAATAQTADTVYINTDVVGPKEVIHDTVFFVRYKNREKAQESKSGPVAKPNTERADTEDMQVFSAAELQTLIDGNKGSSLEEDTLWRRFEAASL